MNRRGSLLAVCFCVLALAAEADAQPQMAYPDRVRIAEAFRLGDSIGNRLWPRWNEAPFAVLLVAPEVEFLIRHPSPSDDFTKLGFDKLLNSDVYFRKRVFDPALLATFPAVNGISTIVVGQPANTQAKTSTRWVVTMLHEHFHQLQDSQPNFYSDVAGLNLSRGDQTGMWMLNFPFPYRDEKVSVAFRELTIALSRALDSMKPLPEHEIVGDYLYQRRKLRQIIGADDYRYLSFQLWKEGVARYTEHRIAQLASRFYTPTKRFRALQDFTTFLEDARQSRRRIRAELSALSIEKDQRTIFYSVGAAEALLLDRVKPNWRNTRYFQDKFDLEKYF